MFVGPTSKGVRFAPRVFGKGIVEPQIGTVHQLTKLGSDCTGSSGAANRTLDIANTYVINELMVWFNGQLLSVTAHYTVTATGTSDLITFLGPLYDDDNLRVWWI